MTLHVYWHTITEHNNNNNDDADPDDPSEVIESDSEDEEELYRFVASPGWVKNFQSRYKLGRYKMKGEKGSADYDVVDPWIHEWLTFLDTNYVQQQHKTLTQVITIIVNFDKCGIQYKS